MKYTKTALSSLFFICQHDFDANAKDNSGWLAKERMLLLIRMSKLRNMPVVYADRQIGILQGVCLEQSRKRVCAFVISSGLRGKRIVPTTCLRMIAEQFILIDGWCKYRRSDEQRGVLFVRDTTGLLIGHVTDYALDEKTMEILAIEVLTGYFPKECRDKEWHFAFSISQEMDAWIIPAYLHNQSCISKEGNKA